MIPQIRRILPFVLVLTAASAHAQFYKLKGGSLSVGAIGEFSTRLTANSSTPQSFTVASPAGGSVTTVVSGQRQDASQTMGFLSSFDFHPVPWAGLELNYGYVHYSEYFKYNYSNAPGTQVTQLKTDSHEATAAYQFHPKHIPFQPFVNIGGGAIDFSPGQASNQWRGAGLLEIGFDIPTRNKHIAFRVQGRELAYRAPNFNTPAISSRQWRSTEEPSISANYRF